MLTARNEGTELSVKPNRQSFSINDPPDKPQGKRPFDRLGVEISEAGAGVAISASATLPSVVLILAAAFTRDCWCIGLNVSPSSALART